MLASYLTLLWILLKQISLSVAFCQEGKETFVIETSKRLESWNTILTASSIIECSRLCAKKGDCCSASYNEKSLFCYLNNYCPPKMENDINSKTFIRKPEIREVAYGKSSNQSSTYSIHYASMAVDADLNTYFHTKMDQSPYWIVDLGKLYEIKRIEIFNRKQGYISTGQRLHDLDITVGTHLCAHYVGPAELGARLVFECQHYEKARFVKLMIRGIEFLHVAEVKVFALDDICG